MIYFLRRQKLIKNQIVNVTYDMSWTHWNCNKGDACYQLFILQFSLHKNSDIYMLSSLFLVIETCL